MYCGTFEGIQETLFLFISQGENNDSKTLLALLLDDQGIDSSEFFEGRLSYDGNKTVKLLTLTVLSFVLFA